jgi:hypothetical protein
LELSITRVAKEWKFFRDLCLDSSIGAGIGAEKTTSTLLLIYPEICIPGERGLWANFDTFFRLTGNT